jgi:hypothetical protein
MSDINPIGSSNSPLNMDSIRRGLGIGDTAPARTASVSAPAPRSDPGAIGGPRGNRILPADFPLDRLDRNAARGTYIDILV